MKLDDGTANAMLARKGTNGQHALQTLPSVSKGHLADPKFFVSSLFVLFLEWGLWAKDGRANFSAAGRVEDLERGWSDTLRLVR